MKEEAKMEYDAVVVLWTRSWQNISERRTYEWRVAFSLWTALAAVISIILTKRVPDTALTLFPGFLSVALFVAAITVVHAWWLHGAGKARDFDRRMAFHYEDKLRQLSNSDFPDDLKIQLLGRRRAQRGLWGDWSQLPQITVTLLFGLAACMVFVAVST